MTTTATTATTRPTASTATTPATDAGTDGAVSPSRSALAGAWPLAGLGAGLASFAFTTLTSHFLTDEETRGGVDGVYAAVEGDGLQTHLGIVAGFAAVVLLAVFAAGFARFLTVREPAGTLAGSVARTGLNAAVATVALAASLKAVYRGGLPDHGDSAMYTREAVVTLQVLIDQYQWAAYWTIALTMGAVAVLALRHKVLPAWYGVLSAVLTVFVLAMTLVLGLPYSAGIAAPVWLVVTAVALLRLRRRLA